MPEDMPEESGQLDEFEAQAAADAVVTWEHADGTVVSARVGDIEQCPAMRGKPPELVLRLAEMASKGRAILEQREKPVVADTEKAPEAPRTDKPEAVAKQPPDELAQVIILEAEQTARAIAENSATTDKEILSIEPNEQLEAAIKEAKIIEEQAIVSAAEAIAIDKSVIRVVEAPVDVEQVKPEPVIIKKQPAAKIETIARVVEQEQKLPEPVLAPVYKLPERRPEVVEVINILDVTPESALPEPAAEASEVSEDSFAEAAIVIDLSLIEEEPTVEPLAQLEAALPEVLQTALHQEAAEIALPETVIINEQETPIAQVFTQLQELISVEVITEEQVAEIQELEAALGVWYEAVCAQLNPEQPVDEAQKAEFLRNVRRQLIKRIAKTAETADEDYEDAMHNRKQVRDLLQDFTQSVSSKLQQSLGSLPVRRQASLVVNKLAA